MKIKRADDAVSEILGTILLLTIVVAVFSGIYIFVLAPPSDIPQPFVTITGKMEGTTITLTHRGGDSLDLDTELVLNIGDTTYLIAVESCLDDTNGDGLWNIGEQVVYAPTEDITYLYVDAKVIDSETNSMLFTAVFQEATSSPLSGNETFVFDDTIIGEPGVLRLPGKLFVIVVYTNNDGHGFVETISLETGTLDTLEYDDQKGYDPTIIHVSGEIFVIAYRDYNDHGYLKTVEIDDNGNITDTVVDALEFDDHKGVNPSIVHVYNDFYAIAYTGNGDHGFIKTVEIDDTGNFIGINETLEFDSVKGLTPKIFHISGDIYAVAYSGDNEHGMVKTVEIEGDGEFNGIKDTLEFESNKAIEPSVIQVSNNIFAIAYGSENDDGFLKTVEIADNGDINDTVLDTLEFDPNKGLEPDIIHISGDIYVIFYRGLGDFGVLKTIEISNSGNITDTVVDTFNLPNICWGPRIIHISGEIYALSFKNSLDNGYMRAIQIANNGDIDPV